MGYEDWLAELQRIFALMGYKDREQVHGDWRDHFGAGLTPAQAIAADMADAA